MAVCCHGYGRNWSGVADDKVLEGIEFMLVTWSTSGTARRSTSHFGFYVVWCIATRGGDMSRWGKFVGSIGSYIFQNVNCRISGK